MQSLNAALALIRPIANATYPQARVDSVMCVSYDFLMFWREWGNIDLDLNEVIGFNLCDAAATFAAIIVQPRRGTLRGLIVDFPATEEDAKKLLQFVTRVVDYQRTKWNPPE